MKKIIFSLMTLGVAGLLLSAVAQDVPGDNNPPPPTTGDNGTGGDNNGPGGPDGSGIPQPPEEQAGTNEVAPPADIVPAEGEENGVQKNTATPRTVILPGQSRPKAAADYTSNFLPPVEATGTNNPDALRLNFNNAPLDMVLNYLSDAAGFIIVLDTHVNGNVSVISSHPMTRDEAVNLLNFVLNKNGYAAIRNGRTLTIVDKNDAKTRNIPVKIGNNPDDVPDNAEIVTQIIPIRFVDAQKLVSDLSSFVSPQATVAANTDGNSILITDTQSNIRHLMEIIQAIDNSAEAETEIRVFHLKYANPTDVATELSSVFPSSTSGSGTQSPIRFGGRGGGRGGNPFGGFFGGGGGDSSGGTTSADRVKKASQVTAVADSRIQAVIVTAPKDLMTQIASMMTDLDVSSTRDSKVYVFHMNNGDPQQAVQVLQNMFQSSSSSRSGSSSSGSSQNSALMQRAQNNATTSGSSSSGSSSGFGSSSSSGGGGRRSN